MVRRVAWQESLSRNLEQRPVLIVHGNIRDCYVDGATEYTDLRSIVAIQADDLASTLGRVSTVRVYDWVKGHRVVSDASEIPTTSSFDAQNPPHTIEDLEADLQQLSEWILGTEGVDAEGTARTIIIEYADLLVPYQQTYDEAQRRLLIRIEKLLGNVQLPHHVVLVALEDSWLPPHLYTQAPRVAILRVPMPEERERADLLRQHLGRGIKTWLPEGQLQESIARMTTGLYLREFDEVLERMATERVAAEQDARELLNEWRTGRRVSPWTQLSLERLGRVRQWLAGETTDARGGVVGQPEAIERVGRGLVIARAGLTGLASVHEQKPRMVFVFAGPTGVGKTELARQIAEFVFGSKDAIIRFDMSEYKGDFTVSRLLGAPPGYIGHEQGGQLTTQVRERPFSILLFDEIEKADEKILDVFLQILDDGRLTDSRGQTVFFGQTALIFTTNVGARNLSYERPVLDRLIAEWENDPETCKREVRLHFRHCVDKFFSDEVGRPELLNRLRAGIVPFNPILEDEVRIAIAEKSLTIMEDQFAHRHREQGLRLEIAGNLASLILGGWTICANDACQRMMLLDIDEAVASDGRSEAACPACRTSLPSSPKDNSGANGVESGDSAFGGRGIADDVEALLSFDLALALLKREASGATGPGRFVAALGERGKGGTALLEVTFHTEN